MKATFIEGFKGILLNVTKEKKFFVKESPKPLLVNEKMQKKVSSKSLLFQFLLTIKQFCFEFGIQFVM